MGVIVVVIGFDDSTKLSSAATSAQGVTPLSCPTCPKSPTVRASAANSSRHFTLS